MLFIPFIVISFFNYPGGEDYSEATLTLELGFWGHIHNLYTTWDGRYFSAALFAIHPLAFYSYFGYKMAAIVIMLLLFLSTWMLIFSLFSSFFNKKTITLITALIFALLLYKLPQPIDIFYYYISSYIYGAAIVMGNFALASLFMAYKHTKNRNKFLFIVLSCVLMIFALGTLESLLILLPCIVFFIGIYRWYFKLGMLKETMIVFLSVLVGVFLHISAPGIIYEIQMNNFDGEFSFAYIFKAIINSILRTGVIIVFFFLKGNYLLYLLTLIFIPISFSLSKKYSFFKKGFNLPILPSLILIFLLLHILALPYYWAIGSAGDDYPIRIFNTVYFYFILSWFFSIHLVLAWMSRNVLFHISVPNKYIKIILLIGFIVCIPFSENWILASKDLLSGSAKQYQKNRMQRIQELKAAKNTDELILYLGEEKSTFIYNGIDINYCAEDWRNAYQDYYLIDTIIVKQKHE